MTVFWFSGSSGPLNDSLFFFFTFHPLYKDPAAYRKSSTLPTSGLQPKMHTDEEMCTEPGEEMEPNRNSIDPNQLDLNRRPFSLDSCPQNILQSALRVSVQQPTREERFDCSLLIGCLAF
ncbi:hypothetical protein NQZ68_036423 [Dissostichus eleginoides]|nr:hypothetical protein NQZ68_036423 [Dissostichus eleginoides]